VTRICCRTDSMALIDMAGFFLFEHFCVT